MEISGEKGSRRKAVNKFHWDNVALKTVTASMFSIIVWLLIGWDLTLGQAGMALIINVAVMTIHEMIWPSKYSFWKDS